MRFLILMAEAGHFDRWEAADDALRQRVFADFDTFAKAVEARGSMVTGDALDRPDTARSIQPGADRLVTDGPFAETVEQLGGFYLIDVPDLDTAVELAGLLPREYTIEVRPTLEVEI
jgi:hypothetical protein